MGFRYFARPVLGAVLGILCLYVIFLSLLTVPRFQNHAIYLHKIKLTWGHNLNRPEEWGFLKNQVTPFNIETKDGEVLHAWHILPIELFRQHAAILQHGKAGFVNDVTAAAGFKLLRDDPDSLLVIYLHGAAGTLASGFRPSSYRAISAGAPMRIHIVAIDYRGFGTSTGQPSEAGLLTDAMALVEWATKIAGIPSSRIVIFGQSIGTAVALALSSHLADLVPPTLFAGIVLIAPFSDVETLTSTYRLAGTVPLLSPVARIPLLLKYLNTFIKDKWESNKRIARLVQRYETDDSVDAKYHISLIHAEDDYDIHWSHSEKLFWYAVNASHADGITFEDLQAVRQQQSVLLGDGGRMREWQTAKGVIREEILKYGLHDRIMSYPIVSQAIMRAFEQT